MVRFREGAMIWYIEQAVTARVARATIGVVVRTAYDGLVCDHHGRKAKIITNPV